jgi:hypothetical protein
MAAPNVNVAPTGGGQGFAASNSAVPDSNTLLAYKLLKDSWGANSVFDDLLKEEMKYLVTGISLLQNDPYLQLKMGGVTLNNAGVLANTLKSKVSELDIRSRIEPTADLLLRHEYGTPTLRELAPGRRNAAKLTQAGTDTDPRYKLDVLAGSFQHTGVDIPNSGPGVRNPNTLGARNSVTYGNNGIFYGAPARPSGFVR